MLSIVPRVISTMHGSPAAGECDKRGADNEGVKRVITRGCCDGASLANYLWCEQARSGNRGCDNAGVCYY